MAEQQRDVVEILVHDHREVEDMFQQLEQLQVRAQNGESLLDERRNLVDRVVIELVRHSVAEEEYVYPAAKRLIPGSDGLVEDEVHEHADAEKTMNALDGMSPDNLDFEGLLRKLMTEIRNHIQEEEGQLFPQLRRHADESELRRLGSDVEKAKKLAPTHPHPLAPDRPPLDKLLGPGAALVDRLRDALTGRGKH